MNPEVLSIHEAARRVGRSRRTIQRWLRDDLPSHQRPGSDTKWIRLEDLQAAFVRRLESDPARPRSAASLEHGTRNRYRAGCNCTPCRAANARARQAQYAESERRRTERRKNFVTNGVTP